MHDSKNSQFNPLLFPAVFSEEECKQLVSFCDETASPGLISPMEEGAESQINKTVRRSSIVRLQPEQHRWVIERLAAIVKTANGQYNYDLENAILEPPQIAAYSAKTKGTYGWHLDIGPTLLTRKISVSVPLNAGYQGGELQFNYGKPASQEQTPGAAITFPSYVMHRVCPVLKGVRYSLVTWVHGKHWR